MPVPESIRNILSTLLVPPARLYGLGMRLSRRLASPYAPGIPCVGVGGMRPGLPGAVLVTSWLLGWADHHGLRTAVTVSPLRGGRDAQTLRATPGADPGVIDAQAIALSMYAPRAAVLSDPDPRRAAESAMGAFRPDLLVAHDGLSRPSPARDVQIIILGQDDLTTGFGRPIPAGRWREDASALRRADMFVVYMPPGRFAEQAGLIEKRLGRYARPVTSVSPRAWRLRQAAGRETARDFGGEPYLLVTTESERRTTPEALSALLPAPRLSVIFPDGHRFTVQDLRQVLADATRLKCLRVVCPPVTAIRLASRLSALGGADPVSLWTYDPDVVFGPSLSSGDVFRDWWQASWERLAGQTPSGPGHPEKKDAPEAE
jgi:tetraacyldisaccharide 4'-kinase